jgi:hypothetical protein
MKLAVHRWRAAGLGACMALAAACSGDGTGTPDPAGIVATTNVTQNGFRAAPVNELPAVRVTDDDGQAMAGVAVTFAVAGGGGTLTGGSTNTNAQGVATVGGWTLGPNTGTNTLTATVAGLTPVTFTAMGADPCVTASPYTVASTVNAALASYDCRLSTGEYVDFYSTTLATAQALRFTMSSATVDTWLELYDPSANILAFNDDADQTSTNSVIRVFAPSGNYFLAGTSFDPNDLGDYTLTSAAMGGNDNCDAYWVVPGVSITGNVATTDCNFGGYHTDEYLVILRPGQTLTVTMRSTAVDSWVELYDSDGTLVDSDDDSGGGDDAILVHTASALDVYAIDASTFDPGQTGAYTIQITRS